MRTRPSIHLNPYQRAAYERQVRRSQARAEIARAARESEPQTQPGEDPPTAA